MAEVEGRPARWPYLVLAAGAAFFFYLHLFRFPFVPIWHPGDESTYLEHAERMLHGQILYRDLFQFNLPGTECLYYLFFRVFGVQLWAGHVALLVALTSISVLVFALSRVVLRGAAAWVPALGFLAICQRAYLDGSHHWYSTALVLLAIFIIARKRSPLRIAFAGGILGIATLFTSTRGVFVAVGVALFLAWELRNRREAFRAMVTLFVPFAAIVGTVLIYLALRVGPGLLFDSLIIFPMRYYPSGAANSFSVYFGELRQAWPLGAHSFLEFAHFLLSSAAMPLLLIAIGLWLFRSGSFTQRGLPSNRALVLYTFASVFALLPVMSAPSAPRMDCALSFAYIVGTAMLYQAGRKKLISAMLGVLLLGTFAEMSAATLRPVYGVTGPRGPVDSLVKDDRDSLEWFVRNAHPGDRVFGDPDTNFLLGFENPAKVPWVERDAYTRPEQVQDLIKTLSNQKTRFVIDDVATGQGSEDNLQPFRDYLKKNYHQACPTCGPVLVRNGS